MLPIPPGESFHITMRQIPEGFDLVMIENTGDDLLTIDGVGIWFPALSKGYDFGPSRISKDYPFPGYPVTLAPEETITYTINVGEIANALEEKQDRIVDFVYFVSTDHNTHHYSEPVSVEAYLRALDPNPLARPTLPNGGLMVARTGAAWRDLPAHFGPWETVHSRDHRWRKAGIWPQILEALSQDEVPEAR